MGVSLHLFVHANHKIVDLLLVCDEVDAPETGVSVARVERLEAVAQVVLGALLGQAASGVAGAAHRSN